MDNINNPLFSNTYTLVTDININKDEIVQRHADFQKQIILYLDLEM